jgi:hypothetical protein
MSHARKAAELDARNIVLHFSPEMKRALGDLAAAVHHSEHVDPDVRKVLQHWAAGQKQTIHDVLIAFPLIAEETFRHIRATGDQRAEDAWREICNQMPERGFILTKTPALGKP